MFLFAHGFYIGTIHTIQSLVKVHAAIVHDILHINLPINQAVVTLEFDSQTHEQGQNLKFE